MVVVRVALMVVVVEARVMVVVVVVVILVVPYVTQTGYYTLAEASETGQLTGFKIPPATFQHKTTTSHTQQC